MTPHPGDLLRSWLKIHPYSPKVRPALRRTKTGAGARGFATVVSRRNGTHRLPPGYDTHGLKAEERAALEDIEAIQDRIRRVLEDMARRRRQVG